MTPSTQAINAINLAVKRALEDAIEAHAIDPEHRDATRTAVLESLLGDTVIDVAVRSLAPHKVGIEDVLVFITSFAGTLAMLVEHQDHLDEIDAYREAAAAGHVENHAGTETKQ